MSSRDYQLYHTSLPALAGRKSFVTLATNSIKLHIDKDEKKGTYLWIDPPWAFGRAETLIESSETCPDHKDPEYGLKFEAWGSRFEPVFQSSITRIESEPSGRLTVFFEGEYELVVPALRPVHARDSWYDHWYFTDQNQKEKTEPNKSATANALDLT